MQRDQAHRTNELLERIAKALEKDVKYKVKNNQLVPDILDTVKKITDDYVVYNGKLKPIKDIPGFEMYFVITEKLCRSRRSSPKSLRDWRSVT